MKTDINFELCCDNKSVLKAINPGIGLTFVVLCKPEGALVHQTRALIKQIRKVTLNVRIVL